MKRRGPYAPVAIPTYQCSFVSCSSLLTAVIFTDSEKCFGGNT